MESSAANREDSDLDFDYEDSDLPQTIPASPPSPHVLENIFPEGIYSLMMINCSYVNLDFNYSNIYHFSAGETEVTVECTPLEVAPTEGIVNLTCFNVLAYKL